MPPVPKTPPSSVLPPSKPPLLRKSTLKMQPGDIVPPALTWPNANEELWGTGDPYREQDWSPMGTTISNTLPYKGVQEDALGVYNPTKNTIWLSPELTSEDEHVLPHEVGHSIWELSLPLDQKLQWEHIHNAQLAKQQQNVGFTIYKDDPSHSFADLMGQYVGFPEDLKARDPYIYNWFRSVLGREYVKRDTAEADTVAAHIPFYWNEK